ncbi:MAG TPA: hypothetical protein VMR06_04915 [Dokdonella sp.]|uniref:hypothetical protein n=1 Tax=Dokdonella sp. TaxID=2291710 RepID=UPI002B670AA7|nr:hypothetical protein [Dokdonella sp.]HUD41322.1 hypothetical protein [Dokdonella sp.]
MTETPTTTAMSSWLEEAWLARYLDRALSTDERDWFEAYMLDKAHLIEQVEVDNALRDAAHVAAPLSVAPDRPAEPGAPPSRSPRRSLARALALAASFVLGVGLTWIGFDRLPHGVPASNPTRIVYDTLRAQASEPLIERGDPDSPWIIVDIAIPSGAQILSAKAVVGGDSTVLRIPTVSSEGFATYLLPAQWQGRSKLRFGLRLLGNTEETELELVF